MHALCYWPNHLTLTAPVHELLCEVCGVFVLEDKIAAHFGRHVERRETREVLQARRLAALRLEYGLAQARRLTQQRQPQQPSLHRRRKGGTVALGAGLGAGSSAGSASGLGSDSFLSTDSSSSDGEQWPTDSVRETARERALRKTTEDASMWACRRPCRGPTRRPARASVCVCVCMLRFAGKRKLLLRCPHCPMVARSRFGLIEHLRWHDRVGAVRQTKSTKGADDAALGTGPFTRHPPLLDHRAVCLHNFVGRPREGGGGGAAPTPAATGQCCLHSSHIKLSCARPPLSLLLTGPLIWCLLSRRPCSCPPPPPPVQEHLCEVCGKWVAEDDLPTHQERHALRGETRESVQRARLEALERPEERAQELRQAVAQQRQEREAQAEKARARKARALAELRLERQRSRTVNSVPCWGCVDVVLGVLRELRLRVACVCCVVCGDCPVSHAGSACTCAYGPPYRRCRRRFEPGGRLRSGKGPPKHLSRPRLPSLHPSSPRQHLHPCSRGWGTHPDWPLNRWRTALAPPAALWHSQRLCWRTTI